MPEEILRYDKTGGREAQQESAEKSGRICISALNKFIIDGEKSYFISLSHIERKVGREIAEEEEIRLCMSMLFDGAVILGFKREKLQNAIQVTFKIVADREQKINFVLLLPDSIEELSEDARLKQDGLFMYQKFMIAI